MKYINNIKLCAIIYFLPIFVFAQEEITPKVESDSIFEEIYSMSLEEMLSLKVTTGSFLNLDLRNSSVNMTIITSEQIEASGARHLSEAIEIFVPGFQYMINKWNGIIWGMRGIASDRNTKFIVLVNGHKMNMESRDGYMAELDLGLLDDIERIEVLRGPAGLVYGSGAIAGVINIITKEFNKDEIVVSAKANTWSMNTYGQEMQMNISRKLSEKANIRVDAGARKSDGVGVEQSKILGRPSWPASQSVPYPEEAEGIPTMGSAQSTPGNYKLGIDLTYDRFRIYSRLTHQVTNGSGWFVVDPWPEYPSQPNSTLSDRWVNGYLVSPDSYYAYSEGFGSNRRQYVLNNISTQASYTLPIKENELKFYSAVDGCTNIVRLEKTTGSENNYYTERENETLEQFGENRYHIGATYKLNSSTKYELAVGYEFSIHEFGKDLSGVNSQNEKAKHLTVSNVTYYNNSFFSEGIYHFTEKFEGHLGMRYDLHTRTLEHGGVISPKIGAVYSFNKKNSLKLFYQQSSNNGSVDNYEFNRYTIGDDGEPFDGDNYHFANPLIPDIVMAPITNDILHKLEPEKSESIELMSFNQITDELVLLPSVSYNTISNLFAWNQDLFLTLNTKEYSFINVDIDVQYMTSKITFGVNHTIQNLVNTDIKFSDMKSIDELFTIDVDSKKEVSEFPVFEGYDSTMVGNQWYYSPRKVIASDGTDSTRVVEYNYIRDAITVDGTNFLSLAPHVSKVFIDYKAFDWITLHASSRIFWGLIGRQDIHEYDPATNTNEVLNNYSPDLANAKNYPHMDIHKSPIFKINLGVVLNSKDEKMKFSFHVYDLLGGNGSNASLHSLRWNQSFHAASATDLYGMDYRSFALKLTYKI